MHPDWLRWVFLLALFVTDVLTMKFFWPFELNILGKALTLHSLSYGLDMVAVSGFFFILGHQINKMRTDAFFANRLTFLISGILLLFLVWYFPACIDLNTRQFDSLAINTTEALIGILFILAVSRQLEKVGWLSSVFSYAVSQIPIPIAVINIKLY